MRPGTLIDRLSAWDEDITRRLFIREDRGLLHNLASILAHSGDSWFWGLGLAALLVFSNEVWKFRASWMLIGALISAIFVFSIKLMVRRSRPAGDWGQIYRKTDPHSFPSGHAARAMVFVILAIYLGPGWLAVILLVWAPCVMLARVAKGVHYLTDVLAGAVVGAVLGGALVWIIPQLSFPFLTL